MGNRSILAVVKADGYGHGAIQVSRTLLEAGAHALAVAYIEEALEIREAGITAPVMVLFGVPSDKVSYFFDYNLTPVVWSLDQACALSQEATRRSSRIPIHIKIDTGMGRLGFNPGEAVESIAKITEMPGLAVEGVLSHFSDAELTDTNVSKAQLELFQLVSSKLQDRGIRIRFRHMANSAAIIRFNNSFLDMVRPGLMLYGYNPVPGKQSDVDLRPAMTIKSTLISLKHVKSGTSISYGRTFCTKRESLIATMAVGYADGFSTALSNRGSVIVRGKIAPVVGRVCMDLTMVDVTEVDGVSTGDEVILVGEEEGHKLWADTMAEIVETIPYEILTSVGKRVKRVYYN